MMQLIRRLGFVCSLLLCLPIVAQDITITSGYVRETIPGSTVTAAYFTINNLSKKELLLVKLSAEFSDKIELHEHKMADGLMKMREVNGINIPAQSKVVLQPYGYHVMIFDLKRPLKNGEEVEFTLYFEDTPPFNVKLPVHRMKKNMPKKQHEHHH